MLLTYDVGSVPLRVDQDAIISGARASQTLMPLVESRVSGAFRAFEDEIVSVFLDKLKAGVDIPNYPQLRDMNEMFFDLMRGIEKTPSGNIKTGPISARPGAKIPEVNALRRNASRIADAADIDRPRIKVCLTGPYTLASFFQNRDIRLFEELGTALSDLAAQSIFSARRLETTILFVDEPVYGFMNDPLLDYGSKGRELLLGAWEKIFRVASERGIETGMHLHNTSDNLFWEADHLGIVESHVDDPLYDSESTKKMLSKTNKRLKASVAITIFDRLITNKMVDIGDQSQLQQRLGETWTGIRKGLVDPFSFLEDSDLMLRRLRKIVRRFGQEHVAYAGPECGFWSFPTYECAMECLRRIVKVSRKFNMEP